MLNSILAALYERDIRKLIDEVNLFKKEDNLWKIEGSIKNTGGNLVLHIIGNLNHMIGTNLAHTSYVRDRDQEFARKGVERKVLVVQLEELIPMIAKTLNAFSPGQMEGEYPVIFDGKQRTNSYMLLHLLAHLNYHLGQVNYLRRILE